MTQKHFNDLTPAEAELLAVLAEECGEVVQAVGKILRHGLDLHHPETKISNRRALAMEMGDLFAAMQLITDALIIHPSSVEEEAERKLERVGKYLHHNNPDLRILRCRR